MDYTTVPLLTQEAMIKADVGAVGQLNSMADFWDQAVTALDQASAEFRGATNDLEPNWTDSSGTRFVGDAHTSRSTIDNWAQAIQSSQASPKIRQVASEIPGTAKAVALIVEEYRRALAQAVGLGMTPEQLEMMYRLKAGAEMNKLAATYQQAIDAVSQVQGGSWQGPNGQHAGARSVDTLAASGITGPAGPQGTAGAQDAGLAGVGADGLGGFGAVGTGLGGVDGLTGPGVGQLPGLGGSSDPSLSGGLGGSPVAPPVLPPVAPPAPMAPVAGAPMMPPMVPGGFGGGGGGGPRGAGVRVPGARLGGGPIPVAAPPVNSVLAPTPAAAPAVPQLATSAPASSGSGGGIPPMVPPMGAGVGVGAAGGGIPGAGLARRRRNERDNDGGGGDPPTPGLHSMLSGKAALPEQFVYATQRRAAEPDAPGTVQLIDAEQWHAAESRDAVVPAATVDRRR